MADLAIQASELVKHYGDVIALHGVDLRVPAHTVYALLGPNGAGKTTLVHILTTLSRPTSGQAQVAGYDVLNQAHDVRRRIGVTFQEISLEMNMSGRQALEIHGQLYRIERRERRKRIAELADLVQLADVLDRNVKTYSGGMKRRLELARGLLTRPQILFLDEPTQGLDPQNRTGIWEYIRALCREQGLTVLLTTHYMEEAEALADMVGIIDYGRMVAEDTPVNLVASLGSDVIRVQGKGDREHLIGHLAGLSFVTSVERDGEHGPILVAVDNSARRLAEVVTAVSGNGFQVEDIRIACPDLGDAFLHYTGRALRD